MFLALVLGVVSCQTEPEGFDVNMGGEQEVLINVSLPEETRADSAEGGITNVIASDDYTIRYIFQVYNAKGDEFKAPVYEYTDDTSVSFPVRLVPGRDYRFVVWADIVEKDTKADLHYNTAYFPAISLNQTWVAMDETRDAYTVSELVTNFHSGKPITLTLKRPLAKLRVITTDMAELLGLTPESATVTYNTPHYNTFNALNSAVGDSKVSGCEHANYTIKGDYETTNGKVLFTDYFFADNEVVNFHMSVKMSDGEAVERSFTTDIPVKRNYLTTIKGNILTDGNNIVVNVEEGFDEEIEYPYEDGIMPANNEIWYTSTDGAIVTPADAFGVEIISNTYNNGLGRIVFDGKLTEIGEYAFGWCKLETVTIPYSIERIDSHAFAYNYNLKSINIPHGVKAIGYGAFHNSKIETIKIPDSIIGFDANAFTGCQYLRNFEGKFASDNGRCLIDNGKIIAYAGGSGTTYTIPNEVTTIGFAAFEGLHLENITISDNVNIIGERAFENCMWLTSVAINDGVTSIERDAFYNCSSLTDVDLGESVEYIGPQAFCYCSNLETITIPESVISIEISAFDGCDNLKSIYCKGLTPPNNSQFLGENIDNCSIYVYNESVNAYKTAWAEYADIISGFGPYEGTETTTIHYSVNWGEPINCNYLPVKENEYSSSSGGRMVVYGILRNIPENAFARCSDLRSIVIPDSVVHISSSAFAYCFGLKNVTIPESVTSIGSYAFYQCETLDSVYCKATTPPAGGDYMFTFNASGRKIYVPMGSVEAYKNAEGWSRYASYIVGYNF